VSEAIAIAQQSQAKRALREAQLQQSQAKRARGAGAW